VDFSRFLFSDFCSVDGDSCKMRDFQDGFRRSYSDSHGYRTFFLMDNGLGCGCAKPNMDDIGKDAVVFNFVWTCDRSILALLFSRPSTGRCQPCRAD